MTGLTSKIKFCEQLEDLATNSNPLFQFLLLSLEQPWVFRRRVIHIKSEVTWLQVNQEAMHHWGEEKDHFGGYG